MRLIMLCLGILILKNDTRAQHSFSSDTIKNPHQLRRIHFGGSQGHQWLISRPFSESQGYYFVVGDVNTATMYRVFPSTSIGLILGSYYTPFSSHNEYFLAHTTGVRLEQLFLNKHPVLKRYVLLHASAELFRIYGRYQYLDSLDQANSVTSYSSGRVDDRHLSTAIGGRVLLTYKPTRTVSLYWSPEVGVLFPIGNPKITGNNVRLSGALLRFVLEFRR